MSTEDVINAESSHHISLLSKEPLTDGTMDAIIDKPFRAELIYQLNRYTTPINALCCVLIVTLIPTFLVDTLVLNQLNSMLHLSIIFILMLVISVSLITNNILFTALASVPLDPNGAKPFLTLVSLMLGGLTASTIYYEYSGWSIMMQVLFRLELSILILQLVYLQYTTKEKTSILLKSFIIHRDTLEMIEEDHHLTEDYYNINIKKQKIIHQKPQLLFIQSYLTSKLLLSCIVVLLLIILGLISLDFWKDKIKFMIFIYAIFSTPMIFSTYQITHYNEKITLIESDLRIRTNLRVKLFWWTPRRELIFGTIISLGVNALRIFVPL